MSEMDLSKTELFQAFVCFALLGLAKAAPAVTSHQSVNNGGALTSTRYNQICLPRSYSQN